MADRRESIEEYVICSICMDLYDDPLALPCMHSFCRRCLQGIVASSMCLKCPECRKDIKLGKRGIEGLARNFQLGCIVSSYQRDIDKPKAEQQSNSRLPSCTGHRLPCQLQCKKCRIPVCLNCATDDQHSTHPFSIIDDTEDIMDADIDVYCEKHSKQYKLYCRTCQSLVCLNCITSKDHTKHYYSAIDNAYEHTKMLLESRLREFERQQQTTRSNWKMHRDLAQKTQSDAQVKRDQLTSYFKRLKDTLEKKERELKLELDNRETRVISDCKRKIDALQGSDKKISNAVGQIKQLLTEERFQLLNTNTAAYERGLMLAHEASSMTSLNPDCFEDVALTTCQFEKEVKAIRWEWPKQVPELSQGVEPTAPPDSMQPVPRPRRRSSQREPLSSTQNYQLQQQNQQQRYQQSYQQPHQQNVGLEIGSLVQRGKHWKFGMEDGGPGHFGTVVQTTVDPNAYMVRWPNGKSGSYIHNPPMKEEIIPP